MSTPSNVIDPERDADGTSSCIRLRIRRKVDFPHPEGPISAVTLPPCMGSEIRSSTLCEPNHALTLVATRVDGTVEEGEAGPGNPVAGMPGRWSMAVTTPPRDVAPGVIVCVRRRPPPPGPPPPRAPERRRAHRSRRA